MVPATTDLFAHRYYRTPKILMSVVGLWPEQRNLTTRCLASAVILLLITGSVPVMMAAIKYREDRRILVDCLSGLGYLIGAGIRIATCAFNSKKMLMMLNRIRTDWLAWAGEREETIIRQYADQGRKLTKAYTVVMYTIGFLHIAQPIVPKIIDNVLNNGTKPGQFLIPFYSYNFDEQKHYYGIMIFESVYIATILTVTTSFDILLIVVVYHVCGIYAAVGHKLEQIGNIETVAETEKTAHSLEQKVQKDRTSEHTICSCIARHNEAIEYATLIENTYTWHFFLTSIFRVAILTLNLFQIIPKINEPQEIAGSVGLTVALILHVYIESYIAQVLIDHSTSIHYHIQNGHWYCLSLKAQKLLQFMMMRCMIPSQLTGGKMINLSLKNFTLFLKTSSSYLAVLRSM